MPLVSDQVLNEIQERCDIAEVIASYIPLKRSGRNFKARCPFHHEKTPSFVVSPDKQIFHCFGCGAGGNVFGFLMRHEKMEFREAVQTLAEKVGITLEFNEAATQEAGVNQQLYKVNEQASIFYHQYLKSKEATSVREYLSKRGLRVESIQKFKIGFAPNQWNALLNFLRSKDISIRLQEQAGLILSKQFSTEYYDRFRNRVIFPIFDTKSRVVGFGGRIMTDVLPKYINSPETPVYSKGRMLYGFNVSKDAIAKDDRAVIVEGYLDCIIPYQEGFNAIVASLGTALTVEQIRLIRRYTHNVVTIFDADKAGELATLRSLDLFIEEGMQVKVASLPAGFDPDSFVRKYGIEEFHKKVDEAINLFDYKLRVLTAAHNPQSIENKARIAGEMLTTIARFKNAVLQSEYVRKLADILSVKEESLFFELKKLETNTRSTPRTRQLEEKKSDTLCLQAVEKMIVRLMLVESKFITLARDNVHVSDFQDQHVKDIVNHLFDLEAQGEVVSPGRLMNRFADSPLAQTITELSVCEDLQQSDTEKVWDDCIKRLKKEGLKLRCKKLQHQIKNAEDGRDEELLKCLIEEYNQLIKG
ncbi:DNA primase [Candidatus Omnitrophota bacterium]